MWQEQPATLVRTDLGLALALPKLEQVYYVLQGKERAFKFIKHCHNQGESLKFEVYQKFAQVFEIPWKVYQMLSQPG
jgi:hypothetical protein